MSTNITGQRAIFFQVEYHLLIVNFFVIFGLVEILHCRYHIFRVIFTLAEGSFSPKWYVFLWSYRICLAPFESFIHSLSSLMFVWHIPMKMKFIFIIFFFLMIVLFHASFANKLLLLLCSYLFLYLIFSLRNTFLELTSKRRVSITVMFFGWFPYLLPFTLMRTNQRVKGIFKVLNIDTRSNFGRFRSSSFQIV